MSLLIDIEGYEILLTHSSHLVPTALVALSLNCAWEAGWNLCTNLYCLAFSETSFSHWPLHWSHSSSYWVIGDPLSDGAFHRRVRLVLPRLDILGGRGFEGCSAGISMQQPDKIVVCGQLVGSIYIRIQLTWREVSFYCSQTSSHLEMVSVTQSQ